MVTKERGIALGVLTADCVPVLFADVKAGVIGAAHAGWKGALAGVTTQTIKAMQALGADPADTIAAIGPAIAQASYEVSDDFRQTFLQTQADYSTYFIPAARTSHWLFDLKAFVRRRLTGEGLQDINLLENDTYLEEDAFFSFRRATHRAEPDYGRQISAIMLK
jgi:YfiH family protein